MYNGDSFGFLFDAPVTDGPYQYMSDPQYVGTTLSLVGTAIYYQSIIGYILAADMYIIFWVSVMFFEVKGLRAIFFSWFHMKNYPPSVVRIYSLLFFFFFFSFCSYTISHRVLI